MDIAVREGGIRIDLDIGDGNLYRTTPHQMQDGPYWWALVDLEPLAGDGEDLLLLHAVASEDPPDSRELVDFLSSLLAVR